MGKCVRCRAAYLADFNRRHNGDGATFDESKTIYRCELVLHDHNSYGDPTVVVYDCAAGRNIVYSRREYQRLKSRGELP